MKQLIGSADTVNIGEAATPKRSDRSRDPLHHIKKSNIIVPFEDYTEQAPTLPEIKYRGKCFGRKCFIHVEDEAVGQCSKTKHLIHVDLAKRQRLCDYITDRRLD